MSTSRTRGMRSRRSLRSLASASTPENEYPSTRMRNDAIPIDPIPE